MELRLKNEKPHFWQWDTGQAINVRGLGKCSFALLNNGVIGRSLRVPFTADGSIWAIAVPDILLQHAESITVHICERTPGGVTTRHTQTFPVAARPKPENYVYTYEEVKTWDGLASQIASLNRNLNLVSERVTTLEKLPDTVQTLQTSVQDLKDAAAGYVKSINDVKPDAAGVANVRAYDVGAQVSTWANSWEDVVEQLGTSNLVHANVGGENCSIPASDFPALLLRGVISRGVASLTAFTATGAVWNGSIDLATGVATLEQYGAETPEAEPET